MSLTLLSDKYADYQGCRRGWECRFYVTPSELRCPNCYISLPHPDSFRKYIEEIRRNKWPKINRYAVIIRAIGGIVAGLAAGLIVVALVGSGIAGGILGSIAGILSFFGAKDEVPDILLRRMKDRDLAQVLRWEHPIPSYECSNYPEGLPAFPVNKLRPFQRKDCINELKQRIDTLLRKTHDAVELGTSALENIDSMSAPDEETKTQYIVIVEVVRLLKIKSLQLDSDLLNTQVLGWKNEIEYWVYNRASLPEMESLTAIEAFEEVISVLELKRDTGKELFSNYESARREISDLDGDLTDIDDYIPSLDSYRKRLDNILDNIRKILLNYQIRAMNETGVDQIVNNTVSALVEGGWKLDMVKEVSSLSDNVFEIERQLILLVSKLTETSQN